MENIVRYLTIIGSYTLFCFVIHFLSIPLSKAFIPNFKTLEKKNLILWYNRAVSMIHAMIMFYLAVYYWLVKNPTWLYMESTDGQYETFVMSVMVGYLVYDSLHESYYGWNFDMFLHHFIGAISHVATLIYFNKAAMYFTMIVYLAEASTPFLSISWIMYQVKLKDTWMFQVASALLLINFFIFRSILSPINLYLIVYSEAIWGNTDIDKYLFYGNTAVVVFFTALNQFWFYKLVKMAFGKKKSE